MVLPPCYTMRAETSGVELAKVSETCRSGSIATESLNLCRCFVAGERRVQKRPIFLLGCTLQALVCNIYHTICLLSGIKVMAWPPYYRVSVAWTKSLHWTYLRMYSLSDLRSMTWLKLFLWSSLKFACKTVVDGCFGLLSLDY